MKKTLFDIFSKPATFNEAHSICEHLSQLLNSRRQSLIHLSDFGLPDLGQMYQKLPYVLQTLKSTVVQLIEKYEPRLRNVRVQQKNISENNLVLYFEIQAFLNNGEETLFNTYFVSGGQVIIKNDQFSPISD